MPRNSNRPRPRPDHRNNWVYMGSGKTYHRSLHYKPNGLPWWLELTLLAAFLLLLILVVAIVR